jgi:hypothetical protein
MSYNNTFGPANSVVNFLAEEFQLPEEGEDFEEFYTQRERDTASAINVREIGRYSLQEIVTGQTWFGSNSATQSNLPRFVFRKVLKWVDATNANSTNLPNNTTGSMAHGITLTSTGFFTNIYAESKNPSATSGQQKYIIIGFASPTAGESIAIWCDDTKVYIKTGNNRSAWTQTNIILEYIKN